MLGVFIINMDESQDRLDLATKHLADRDLSFTRISAFDGRNLDPLKYPDYNDNETQAIMGRSLVGGEIGCFVSHRRALKAFLDSDLSHAMIFEDDALLTEDLTTIVPQAIDWLDKSPQMDWRVINLGRFGKRLDTELTEFVGKSDRFIMKAEHYYPMGAFALCWSRKGAAEFLKLTQEICAPYDNTIQNWLCRVGGGITFTPALASVTWEVDSVIDMTPAGESPIRGKNRRGLLYGLRKQWRLWKNRLWAIAHKAGLVQLAVKFRVKTV